MVYTLDLGIPVSLVYVVTRYFNIMRYNRRKFAAAVLHLKDPVVTVLLFSTGKVVVTGCKSTNDMYVASLYVIRLLRRIGIFPKYTRYRLRNVVGNATLGTTVDLDMLALALREEARYEPDTFPGLIYRPYDGGVSLLVFDSGAIVLTGCKDEATIANAYFFVDKIKQIVAATNEATADGYGPALVHRHCKRIAL